MIGTYSELMLIGSDSHHRAGLSGTTGAHESGMLEATSAILSRFKVVLEKSVGVFVMASV